MSKFLFQSEEVAGTDLLLPSRSRCSREKRPCIPARSGMPDTLRNGAAWASNGAHVPE
ncbi:MAG: hypothetical protein RL141_586, partial [Candidatus Parcubacteria bacterium]